MDGFIDAYLYYYKQILSAFDPKHCQVCDYTQLVPTLASATESMGLNSNLSMFATAFSELQSERVDPRHNKPGEREHMINEGN